MHRIDKAAVDIGRQLDRVRRAVAWHRGQVQYSEKCRDQIHMELQQRQSTLQEHSMCVDVLKHELAAFPSEMEKYAIECEKENLKRACDVCEQEIGCIQKAHNEYSLRVIASREHMHQMLMFRDDQQRRLETLQTRVEEMEREQAGIMQLVAEKSKHDREIKAVRDDILRMARISVTTQCKLRRLEEQQETTSSQRNTVLMQLGDIKAHGISLKQQLTNTSMRLDAYHI